MDIEQREEVRAEVKLFKNGDVWQWVVIRCPFCGKEHWHGGGAVQGDPIPYLGWRLSHCLLDAREYRLVQSKDTKV